MNTFFSVSDIMMEASFRRKQIMANIGWEAGGTILSIFTPVNSGAYKDRFTSVDIIYTKSLQRIKKLKQEEQTPQIQKRIKLLKLLNMYCQKVYHIHTSFMNGMRR